MSHKKAEILLGHSGAWTWKLSVTSHVPDHYTHAAYLVRVCYLTTLCSRLFNKLITQKQTGKGSINFLITHKASITPSEIEDFD